MFGNSGSFNGDYGPDMGPTGSPSFVSADGSSNSGASSDGSAGGAGGNALVALIAALAQMGSGLIARNESKKSAQRNLWNALAISEKEFQQNLQMWHLQNQYNTPGQQMARLQQAGLNPNLVYGSGNVSGNQSGAPPQYRGRTTDMSYTPLQIPDMLSMYQNFAMRQAQINNVKAATEATRTKTVNEAIRTGLLETLGKKSIFELDRDQQLAPYQVDSAKSASEKARTSVSVEMQRLKNLSVDEQIKILNQAYAQKRLSIQDVELEKKQAEAVFLKYKNDLREHGIHEGDNILLRMIIRMANEAGFNLMDEAGDLLK